MTMSSLVLTGELLSNGTKASRCSAKKARGCHFWNMTDRSFLLWLGAENVLFTTRGGVYSGALRAW